MDWRRRALWLAGAGWALPAVAAADKERAEVPEVPPVSAGGVRYQAPQFTRARGLPRNGGYIEALDAATGQPLWLVDVLGPQPDDGKEGDKQDVFLTSLQLSADRRHLLVTDERGQRYRLNLANRQVTRLRPR